MSLYLECRGVHLKEIIQYEMEENGMEDKLIEIVQEVLGSDEITLDTDRESCVEWDSAAHLILLSALEEDLEIEVPIEEVAKIKTPRDFLGFMRG